MDAKTLMALNGSIAKWESIVAGTGEDLLGDNCTLCQAFIACAGCPVAKKTGQGDCGGSPWTQWYRSFKPGIRRVANTPARKRLAQAELDFLRSLLPIESPAPSPAQRAP